LIIKFFALKKDEDKLDDLKKKFSHFFKDRFKRNFHLFIGRGKMSVQEYFPKYEFLKHEKTIEKILRNKGIQAIVQYNDYAYQI
jgi:hypothetical protein